MEGQAAAEGGPLYALPLVLQQVDSLELPVPDIDDDERARAVAFLAHGSFLARAAPVVLPALLRWLWSLCGTVGHFFLSMVSPPARPEPREGPR